MSPKPLSFLSSIPSRQSGFTLLELVVTSAVVAFLGLLFIPALAKTKPNGKATQCLNNLRQFTAAWTMYVSDNRDRVANNYWVPATEQAIQSGTLDNWANNIMTWGATTSLDDQSNTNASLIVGGVLGKYLGDPVRVYKCPADTFLSPRQLAAGWQARLRSISMNSVFGRYSTGNDSTAQGLNWLSQYLQYLKQSSVPKPAKTWLVLDEHPDSINDGFFIVQPGATSWGDIPASYHNGACAFAFADGHSELKKWQSPISIPPVYFFYGGGRPFDNLGQLDFAWYLEHTGYVAARTGLPAFNY